MASFSFGAGNAGKLLRVPLYVLGRVASLAVRRTSDLWVFGSAVGFADGGWALWQHAVHRGERTVWLTEGRDEAIEAQARGIRAVAKSSVLGFWLTARAAVIVVTHGFGDVNRYGATGGIIVQLWHGIPLKRIGLDAAVTTASPLPFARRLTGRLLAVLYRSTQGRIRVLPAASELVRGRLESAFGLDTERVPVTGEPRTDVLSRGTAQARRDAARAELSMHIGNVAEGTRAVLYAPTWRDGERDPGPPGAGETAALHEMLEQTDSVLLVRSHHLGAGDYAAMLGPRVRLLGSNLVADITPLLPAFDAVITDYSSLAYDAALVPLATLFFAPDLAEYARNRGFYGTYAELAGGDAATDWSGVLTQLREELTDPAAHAARVARAAELGQRMHAFADGRNTERVYRTIRHLLSPSERPS